MARNGSGTYSLYTPGNPAVTGTSISSTAFNATMNDIATALTQSVSKDGQTPITGNQAMSGYKHTGVGNATARDSYSAAGQVQDGKLNWVDSGGTADAITATYSPAITALVDGQLCFVRASAANATTTPTFAPNGLTAHTIVKEGGSALAAGNIAADGHELILRYDLANTRWELLNPKATVPVFTSSYESTAQTITSAGSLSLTHGLGAAPKMVNLFLECQSNDQGYTTGQVVQISSDATATTSLGVSLILGATTIDIRFGSAASVFQYPRAATGVVDVLDNTKWKLIVRAYK